MPEVIIERLTLNMLKAHLLGLKAECISTGILELSNKALDTEEMIKDVITFIKLNQPTQVYLENCAVSDDVVEILFGFLKTESSMQLLSLRNNLITSRGLNAIVDALKFNKTLTCIDLLRNALEDARPITNLLLSSKTLSSVCGLWSHFRELLVRNSLKPTDIELITADLRKNTHLAFLELRASDNIQSVLTALEQNTSLISLKFIDVNMDMNLSSSMAAIVKTTSTLKSLSFVRSLKLTRQDIAVNTKSLQFLMKAMEKNFSITCFRLENFPLTNDLCLSLCSLIKTNESIIHLAFFKCEMTTSGLSIFSKGLSTNDCLKCVKFVPTSFIAEDLAVIDSSTSNRTTSLLVRLDEDDHFFGKGRIVEEWEVDDVVEAKNKNSEFMSCRVVSISSSQIYHVLFHDGDEDEALDGKDIKKGVQFLRPVSLVPDLDLIDLPSTTGELISNQPYGKGDPVQIRFYGDCVWYPAKVLYTSKITNDLLTVCLDDDPSVDIEIEVHMVRTAPTREITDAEAVSAIYDAGTFERGDYAEVKVSNDSWLRGRVAVDNCNGTYDVRMEDGTDEKNIQGRLLRPLFRPNDKVDARVSGTSEWLPGKIIRNEKNGSYTVEFTNGDQLTGVVARSIMLAGRVSAREVAKEMYLSVLEVNEIGISAETSVLKNNKARLTERSVRLPNPESMKPSQPSSPRPSVISRTTREVTKSVNDKEGDDEFQPVVSFSKGDRCQALYNGGATWLSGTVTNVRGNGTYDVLYDTGAKELGMTLLQLRDEEADALDDARQMLAKTSISFRNENKANEIPRLMTSTASSLRFYPGQAVEARFRDTYQFLPAVVLNDNADSTYDIRHVDGAIQNNIHGSSLRAGSLHTDLEATLGALPEPQETEFGVMYSHAISTDRWIPVLVTISSGDDFGTTRRLARDAEVVIVPTCEGCRFFGDGQPSGRVCISSETVGYPFFVQACTGKESDTFSASFCFYSCSILISKIEVEFTLYKEGDSDITQKRIVKASMFTSIFLVSENSDSESVAVEDMMERALVCLPGIAIRRPERKESTTKMLLLNSEQIQFVCSKKSLLTPWAETSDAAISLSAVLSSQGMSSAFTIVARETLPDDIRKDFANGLDKLLPTNALSFCPDFEMLTWIDKGSKDYEQRSKLSDCLGAITKIFTSLAYGGKGSPFPMGLFYLSADFISRNPKLVKIIKFPPVQAATVRDSKSWFLCFFSDDCFVKSSIPYDSSFNATELPIDLEFLYYIHSLLKATIAVLICLKLSSGGLNQFSPLIAPFNGHFLAQQLELSLLLDIAAFYEETLATSGKNLITKPQPPPKSAQGQRGTISSPRRDSKLSPNKNTPATPEPVRKKIDESLVACTRLVESSLAMLQMNDLRFQLSAALTRLHALSVVWRDQSGMVQLCIGSRYWWLCKDEIEERWHLLSSLSEPRLSALPQSKYFNRYFSQVSKNAEANIYDCLMKEIGLQDATIAMICASKLTSQGCESWSDVLNLADFVGDRANYETVRAFLIDISIPAVAAGKIVSHIKKVAKDVNVKSK